MREDITFLGTHRKLIDYLGQKGWVVPKNRLVAGDFLESAAPILGALSYRFDPETVKNFADTPAFKVTRIFLDAESVRDVDLYVFLGKVLEKFPGILVPREVTLIRQPQGMKGKFIFEWVAMGGTSNGD